MHLPSITPYFVYNHKKVCKSAEILSLENLPLATWYVKEFKLAELHYCYFLFKHELMNQFVYQRMNGIKIQST